MRLACIQTDVVFGDPARNAERAIQDLNRAKSDGVDLVVFPEAFLTGYCARDRQEAESIALEAQRRGDQLATWPDSLGSIFECCRELGIHAVLGFAGRDDSGLYNAAVLIDAKGENRIYVKTHLPELGFDRFATPGRELKVFETEIGRIGIIVCYDLRPPEACRVLALQGAEVVVLPTNWPARKGTSPAIMCPTRAMENKIYFASCNRIGEENGFEFRGESGIYGLGGEELAAAGGEEAYLMADLDLALAREKRSVVIPGAFEIDAFDCRQPDLYHDLI